MLHEVLEKEVVELLGFRAQMFAVDPGLLHHESANRESMVRQEREKLGPDII
jgi:hypothetical protein